MIDPTATALLVIDKDWDGRAPEFQMIVFSARICSRAGARSASSTRDWPVVRLVIGDQRSEPLDLGANVLQVRRHRFCCGVRVMGL